MPHVIGKLLAGRTRRQKARLAEEVTKVIMATTGNGEEAASVELTPNDLCEIDEAASRIEVQGARYAEATERMTGVEAAQPEGVRT